MPEANGLVGAVDVGATKTLLAVVPAGLDEASPALREVLRHPIRIPTDGDPDRHIAAVAAGLASAAAGGRLRAVGVAAPGPLDPDSGVILHSPNLGWRDHPFGPRLSARLAAPVVLEDDANAGALGEAILGGGRGANPVVFLTLSTGVGAGIVIDGRLVRGAHHAAGEVGHFAVNPAGPRCGCGGRGHVEAFVGGASLAERARRAWPDGRTADGRPGPPDAETILRAARTGDPIARVLADDAIEAVATALAVLAASIDPERIVVGGSIGLGQWWLVRRAATIARGRVIGTAGRGLVVVSAELRALAPLSGATVSALRAASRC